MDFERLHKCMIEKTSSDAIVLTFRRSWLPRVVRHIASQTAVARGRYFGEGEFEEIESKVFETILLKIHSIVPGTPFRRWICKAIEFESMNMLRKKRPVVMDFSEDHNVLHLSLTSPDASMSDFQSEMLEEEIRRLPENQKKAIIARYISDLSSKEVAKMMNSSINQVDQWCYKARNTLYQKLHQHFPEYIKN